MILNVVVVAFVVLLVIWFSTQGLFSALLHLVAVLVAGSLALAVWEPLTVGLLIDRMPEYAWSVGLLAPFVLSLLVLRLAADKLVPGNVTFHNLVDAIGGGAAGLLIGAITAGFTLIGLQFLGTINLMSYQPYRLTPTGQLERVDELWMPADRLAGTLFTQLSGGVFSPLLSEAQVATRQPHLVKSAGMFQLTPRADARRSIRPETIEVDRWFAVEPAASPDAIEPAADARTVVVGLHLQLSTGGEAAGAADPDGVFTASPAQIVLIAVQADNPARAQMILPHGWVHRIGKAYGPLRAAGQMLRTEPVSEDQVDVIFHVPQGYDPRFIRVKQLRLALQDQPTLPGNEVERWLSEIAWPGGRRSSAPADDADSDASDSPTTDADPASPDPPADGEDDGIAARLSHSLPEGLNINTIKTELSNVGLTDENQIVSMRGSVNVDQMPRSGRRLTAADIAVPGNQRLVRLELTPDAARRLYDMALKRVAGPQAPLLVDERGYEFGAIGAAIDDGPLLHVQIDTGRTITSIAEIDQLDRMAGDDRLYLYFRVSRGANIAEFRMGPDRIAPLDLTAE